MSEIDLAIESGYESDKFDESGIFFAYYNFPFYSSTIGRIDFGSNYLEIEFYSFYWTSTDIVGAPLFAF